MCLCVTLKAGASFFSVVLVHLSSVNDQVNLQDREIKSYKKSTTEEQEKNEVLTMQLNRGRMDCDSIRKLISQKQAQEEALRAHYSTLFRSLQETERTLARLSKVGRRQLCCSFILVLQRFLLKTNPYLSKSE